MRRIFFLIESLSAVFPRSGGLAPAHWHKPFRNRTRTYLDGQEWFTNTDVAARFLTTAKQVWEE